jgi:ComF family protein
MLQKILTSTLNFILPPFCAYCRAMLSHDSVFCAVCMSKIFPVVSKTISLTGTKSMTVYCVGGYYEPLKSLIMAKKWSDVVASKQMADLIWEGTPLNRLDFDILVPIPLHWTRYVWRGYNQAELLAARLSRKSGKPSLHLLQRIKRTEYQSSLSASQRPENVKKAFSCVLNADYSNKHLVLVDDLMTTGTTLHEAGRALLSLKPATISAVVLSRVV